MQAEAERAAAAAAAAVEADPLTGIEDAELDDEGSSSSDEAAFRDGGTAANLQVSRRDACLSEHAKYSRRLLPGTIALIHLIRTLSSFIGMGPFPCPGVVERGSAISDEKNF